MRKLFYFCLALFSAFALYSCGSKSDQSQVREVQTDTILPEPEPEPVVEPPFVSNDLKWAQLQGHVKSMSITAPEDYQMSPEKYNFDAEGTFIPEKGSVVRNAEGRITKYTYTFIVGAPDYPCREKGYHKYKYNEDGYVVYDHHSFEYLCCDGGDGDTFKYTIGENGWPISCYRESAWGSDGSVSFYKESYTYPKIDDHGNWTELRVKSTFYKYIECDEEGYPDNEETEIYTITRHITYLEDSK
jgi:hypothetical protein